MKYIKELKELRIITDNTVSITACHEVLVSTAGNIGEAVLLLEGWGDFVPKQRGPETDQGIIYSYSHPGQKLAIMVEVNCATDKASTTPEFQEFCKRVALQIANMYPEYVSKEDIPVSLIAQKRRTIIRQLKSSNRNVKPSRWQYVVGYQFDRWITEVCLLEQKFVENPAVTIDDLRKELISKTGEYIQIKRFIRWELGD